jgi:tetratricopeptide (TPR) repeat protein
MKAYKSKDEHIDAIRRHFGITLAAVSEYNSQHGDEIRNSGEIFRLGGADKEKTLALLYMFSEGDGMDDARYNSADVLVTQYGVMLVTALIYNPNFYAMAANYYEAVNAGLATVTAGTVFPFPKTYRRKISISAVLGGKFRMVFAAAAVIVVIFFITLLVILGGGTGRRISNDWIVRLTPPQKSQDGISFVSGSDGARIGIKPPNMGMAMAANTPSAEIAKTAAYYTRAIRTDKNNAALYVNRGVAYTLRGNIDSAIKDFDRAIKLDPNNISARYNRAVAYVGKGDSEIELAIADFMTVIAMSPDGGETYYETYYVLGSLYMWQYELDGTQARALLEKAYDSFSHIEGYKDVDFILDNISQLL